MLNNSREEILQRIATARKGRFAYAAEIPPFDEKNIYQPIEPSSVDCFKKELESINGQCIVSESENDLYSKLHSLITKRQMQYIFCRDREINEKLQSHHIQIVHDNGSFMKMQAAITGCELLISRTGSIVVSSSGSSGRQMNVFPPVHIVVAKTSQLVNYATDAIASLQQKYGEELPSSITFITGPSRTADIEKNLVLGAHGPKELIVFLLKD